MDNQLLKPILISSRKTKVYLFIIHKVVKGFTLSEFQKRREKFSDLMMKNSIAIIPSNMTTIMTHDIPYTFRQNSNFYYLTGFMEPTSILVIQKMENKVSYILFVRPKDFNRELWDGARCGVEKANQIFGVEDTRSIDLFETEFKFPNALNNLYYDNTASSEINSKVSRLIEKNQISFQEFINNNTIFDVIKSRKSDSEIQILKETADISAEAFKIAIKKTKPGMTEAQIEAILEFESRMRGAQRLAYPPVVASGNNANTMHYVQNTQILKDGDLLLVDAGAEYYQYPSDITRTWPVNGKFSEAQKDIYEAVLNIQKKCIEKCEPGITYNELNQIFKQISYQELINLKVCDKSNVEKV